MATLVDEAYMRATFKIHKDVVTGRITPYIAVASRRLKKWVGADVYASAEFADELKLAEATLVMHFLIRNLNTHIRPDGIVATETVEDKVTLRYFNPVETAQTEQGFLEQAEELIRELLINAAENGIEIVTDERQVCSGLDDTFGEWQT